MKLIKPSIYLNVLQEQQNPGGTQLIRVEADGKRVIHHANQSHSSIKFGCFEKAFVNLQNSNLNDQSRMNFLHGYNTKIVLMQTAPDNGISMLQVLLQRIGINVQLDSFCDKFMSDKADQLSTSLGYLSFRYHLLDEFVLTLNVIVVPENVNLFFVSLVRVIL